MATWYSTGTLSVNNGSTSVTGAGTAWVANVNVGDAIHMPDERTYEVEAVNSDTALTLARAYEGSNVAGGAYTIQPTTGVKVSLRDSVQGLISTVEGHVDGALAGKFGDGSAGTPAVSFASDTDTGLYRKGANALGFATGGSERASLDASEFALNVPIVGAAVQSSPTDATADRLLKVGAGGLLAEVAPEITDFTAALRPGLYRYLESTATNAPGTGGTWFGSALVLRPSPIDTGIIVIATRSSEANLRTWVGVRGGDTGTLTWTEVLTENDVQSSPTDATADRLLKVGAGGLLAEAAPQITDFTTALRPGLYRYLESTATNAPGTGGSWFGSALVLRPSPTDTRMNVIATRSSAANLRTWIGVRGGDTGTLTWTEVLTDANTTVDGSGFILEASPIVRLYTDAIEEPNEAVGVTLEHPATGVYVLRGAPPLATEGWRMRPAVDRDGQMLAQIAASHYHDGGLWLYVTDPAGRLCDVPPGVFALLRFWSGDEGETPPPVDEVPEAEHAARFAQVREAAVKAETTRRIDAVAKPHTRENMIGAQAAGLMTTDQQAAYVAAINWIAAMRAACQAIIADPALEPGDDANWPDCPAEVFDLARAF